MKVDLTGIDDPLVLLKVLWPRDVLYREQREIVYAVRDTPEVFVPAGNKLGKDFIAGKIALGAFLAPNLFLREKGCWERGPNWYEVRILTTSVADHHLAVLWGEIMRNVQSCALPLDEERGGPLIINHRHIRKLVPDTTLRDEISYLKGQVSETAEGMAGHHATHTLLIGDEASGLHPQVFTQGAGWAKHQLWIGNCNPCSAAHPFCKGCEGGDILA
jgi:hypothetical protein